jgi:type IV pilus assembly protein PilB
MSDHDDTKACPNCGEAIKVDAILCRFCQRGLSSKCFRPCTHCAEMIRTQASLCRYCKGKVEPLERMPNQSMVLNNLVKRGIITPEELDVLQLERQKTGEPVSLILSRLGLATENHIKNALELQYGVNYVNLAQIRAPQELLSLLPESLMRQNQFVPLMQDGKRLTVAMVNPNNLMVLDDIKVRLKGIQIRPVVCTQDDFQEFMDKMFGQRPDPGGRENFTVMDSHDADVDLSELEVLPKDIGGDFDTIDLKKQSQDAPIILLANHILAKAIKGKVSHIHIEPHENEVHVRYRRGGSLEIDRRLPKVILPGLVARYKVMSELDIAERKLPQAGRIRVRLSGKDIDFEISTVPSRHGEKVVLKLLDG